MYWLRLQLFPIGDSGVLQQWEYEHLMLIMTAYLACGVTLILIPFSSMIRELEASPYMITLYVVSICSMRTLRQYR